MKRKTLTPDERARQAADGPYTRDGLVYVIEYHIRAAVRAALRKRRGKR
jgi:hypothetical protein